MNIILASNNSGKLRELAQTLSPLKISLVPQSNFNIGDIAETGLSFVENALLKARNAARISLLPAIADDSGLVVPALKGEPGIYSARYAGENASDKANIKCLLANMAAITQRSAYFYCALAFVIHYLDPCPLIAVGKFHGELLNAPRGNQGFGYDPIFYVNEYQLTAAEMDKSLKNTISHRAIASQKLLSLMKEEIFHDNL